MPVFVRSATLPPTVNLLRVLAVLAGILFLVLGIAWLALGVFDDAHPVSPWPALIWIMGGLGGLALAAPAVWSRSQVGFATAAILFLAAAALFMTFVIGLDSSLA